MVLLKGGRSTIKKRKYSIYLDNAATTPVNNTAKEAILSSIDIYGNPSSPHDIGREAKEQITLSKRYIAQSINANEREIYPTSCGSESNTWAIKGAAALIKKQHKTHIISTTIEHQSILKTLKQLEDTGFQITLIEPEPDGVISVKKICDAIRDDTGLVSVMWINNEIGTIQPIREIGRACKERGVIFHTDAVQAVGHIPIDINSCCIDMMSASAHKFGGIKGAGFLYCTRKIKLPCLINGGTQNAGRRAGTENTIGIVAMSNALKESCRNMLSDSSKIYVMREYLLDRLMKIPGVRLNGSREHRAAGNINIGFEGVPGEALAAVLCAEGIYISTISACSSASSVGSHVIKAIGGNDIDMKEAVRITIGRQNTMDEIKIVSNVVTEIVGKLRKMKEEY